MNLYRAPSFKRIAKLALYAAALVLPAGSLLLLLLWWLSRNRKTSQAVARA